MKKLLSLVISAAICAVPLHGANFNMNSISHKPAETTIQAQIVSCPKCGYALQDVLVDSAKDTYDEKCKHCRMGVDLYDHVTELHQYQCRGCGYTEAFTVERTELKKCEGYN